MKHPRQYPKNERNTSKSRVLESKIPWADRCMFYSGCYPWHNHERQLWWKLFNG